MIILHSLQAVAHGKLMHIDIRFFIRSQTWKVCSSRRSVWVSLDCYADFEQLSWFLYFLNDHRQALASFVGSFNLQYSLRNPISEGQWDDLFKAYFLSNKYEDFSQPK